MHRLAAYGGPHADAAGTLWRIPTRQLRLSMVANTAENINTRTMQHLDDALALAGGATPTRSSLLTVKGASVAGALLVQDVLGP